MRETYTNK